MWLLQSRRSALLLLERIRLLAKIPAIAAIAEKLQRPLITKKYRPYMFQADGTRRSLVSYRDFLGSPIVFTSDDTLVCAGAPWEHADIHVIRSLKERHGFCFVALCHDVIPLMFPQFYKQADVDGFRAYYEVAFPVADLVVFTAQATMRDAVAYCQLHGLKIGKTCVVRPGADAARTVAEAGTPLPAGLKRGRYALFVSTIEPRKGHQLIYNIWLRLLAEGLPQKTGFKLVFVGRPGWKVDELVARLRNNPKLQDTLVLLTHVTDDQLGALYRDAAFCLYPSAYEGYGLPIVEAFARGKAVLASNGGAIPEVVAGLSPCLDPHDEELWHSMLAKWISDPAAHAPYEAAIRRYFRPVTWRESARNFFDAVAEVSSGDTAESPAIAAQSVQSV
jgi:glycosyltransferase involved in cell wall biosynthesis